MKILTVCGNGIGSSLMLAMKIEELCKEEGIDAQVESSDFNSAQGKNVDLIVTHKNLYDRAKMVSGNKEIITIENYLKDTNIDMLIERIKQENNK